MAKRSSSPLQVVEGLNLDDFDQDEGAKICNACSGRWSHGLQSSIEDWGDHIAQIPDYLLQAARALATDLDWQSARSDNGINASLVDKYFKLLEEIRPAANEEDDDLEEMAD